MAIIGGSLGYRILRAITKDGETGYMDGSVYAHQSKLEILLGKDIWRQIAEKVVIDFGCGTGNEAKELALRGAKQVIGLDVNESLLNKARINGKGIGNLSFGHSVSTKADVIISIDAFEHFAHPDRILELMAGMLNPDGILIVSFGPTWYHPLGGHLYSVFPWAHLVFTEKALIRWRNEIRDDVATGFLGPVDGLNQMTIRRFEKLVHKSPFEFISCEAVPIRKLKPIANRITREFTTSLVRARLKLS